MQAVKGFDMAGKGVFIGLPAYDFKVSLKLAVSLARFAQLAPKHGIDINIGSVCGCSVVSRARNLLVRGQVAGGQLPAVYLQGEVEALDERSQGQIRNELDKSQVEVEQLFAAREVGS
jgi:hypothetical protein